MQPQRVNRGGRGTGLGFGFVVLGSPWTQLIGHGCGSLVMAPAVVVAQHGMEKPLTVVAETFEELAHGMRLTAAS